MSPFSTLLRFVCCLFLLLSLPTIPLSAQQIRWERVGSPDGGFLYTIVDDGRGRLYVPTMRGVAWSDDGGGSWNELPPGNGPGFHIMVAGEERLVFTNNHEGLFRWDAGAGWKKSGTGMPLPRISDISDMEADESRDLLFVSTTESGIYRSSDQGGTWSPIDSTTTGRTVHGMSLDRTRGWLYAWNTKGLFRSTDGGAGWTTLIDRQITRIATIDSTIIASMYHEKLSSLHRSTDLGATWTELVDAPDDYMRGLAAGDAGEIYAYSDSAIYVSSGGETWTRLEQSDLPVSSLAGMTVVDGDLYMATEGEGVYRRNRVDGSWEPRNRGLVATSLPRLVVTSAGTIIGSGYGTSLYRSTDDGEEWEALTLPYRPRVPANSFAVTRKGEILVGTNWKGVFASTDEGVTWTRKITGMENDTMIRSVAADHEGGAYAATPAGLFHWRADGDRWEATGTSGSWGAVVTASRGRAATLLFRGYTIGHDLFVTIDSGRTWTQVNTAPIRVYISDFRMLESGDVLVFTEVGMERFRFQGGIYVADPVIMQDTVLSTITVGPDGSLFGVTPTGLVRSTDDGETWQASNDGLEGVTPLSIVFTRSGRGIVGTFAHGVYRSGGITGVPEEPEADVSPNPFASSTTIAFTLETRGKVTLEIFDIRGARMATLLDTLLDAGPYSIVWSPESGPGGFYFYRIVSPDGLRDGVLVRTGE